MFFVITLCILVYFVAICMKKDDVDKGAIVVEETEVMPCCFPNFKSFSVKSKEINEGCGDFSSFTYIKQKKGFSWNNGKWRNAFYVNNSNEFTEEYILKNADIAQAIAYSSLITSLLSLQQNKDLTNKIFYDTYNKCSEQDDSFIAKNILAQISTYEDYNEEKDQKQKIKFTIKAIKNNNEVKEITSLKDIINIQRVLINIEKV